MNAFLDVLDALVKMKENVLILRKHKLTYLGDEYNLFLNCFAANYRLPCVAALMSGGRNVLTT